MTEEIERLEVAWMPDTQAKIAELETTLGHPLTPAGALFFSVRVQEGAGYHGTLVVPAKDKEDAVAVYWHRRVFQSPSLPVVVTESTPEAYCEQLLARLRR